MAVSIGGILYSVGMNTSGYEAGAKRIESTEARLRKQEKANRFESAIEAKRVNTMLQEFELARMEYKQANAKLTERSSKEEIKAVEKLYKRYTKLGEAYDNAVANLKKKIQLNNFNINQMKEEAEAIKATTLEEIKLRQEREAMLKSQRKMQSGINILSRAAGIGTVALLIRKLVMGLVNAGEEARKLQDEFYEKGIFNPEAWTHTNQQLAKFGNLTRGVSNAFSSVTKTGLAFTATLGEMLFTWSSYSTIAERNEETARKHAEEAERIANAQKRAKEHAERMKELESELEEIAERRRKEEELEDQSSKERWQREVALSSQIADLWENYKSSKLSGEEQLNKLLAQQKQLKWDIVRLENDKEGRLKAQLELTKTTIQIDKIQNQFAKEKAQADEKARKEAEAEAKKLADKQKQIALARQDFELQFKIAKLEKGNAQQQAQAEAIKNAIKRNELMEKYGYSIEQATRVLKAQKDLENQGKVKYSEKDIEKAQKIVKRSETNFVGKKTLEQAQAILNGQEIKGKRLSVFENVKPMKANPMQFANIPTPTVSPITQQSIATQSPIANAQATPTATATQTQSPSNVLKQILDAINNLPTIFGTQLKEVFSE